MAEFWITPHADAPMSTASARRTALILAVLLIALSLASCESNVFKGLWLYGSRRSEPCG
jgi:hypothetical protein